MFYVYKTTNLLNNMIYIGVHSYKSESHNIKYLGSGTNIIKALFNFGFENFKKEILFEYNNKEQMLAKECELVNEEFIAREDTYNIILGGGTFVTTGCISVKDMFGNTFMVHKTDARYISGELKILIKDKYWMYNEITHKHKTIEKYELQKYLEDGWVRRRNLKKPRKRVIKTIRPKKLTSLQATEIRNIYIKECNVKKLQKSFNCGRVTINKILNYTYYPKQDQTIKSQIIKLIKQGSKFTNVQKLEKYKEEIIKLRQEGLSLRKIGKIYNVGNQDVKNVINGWILYLS